MTRLVNIVTAFIVNDLEWIILCVHTDIFRKIFCTDSRSNSNSTADISFSGSDTEDSLKSTHNCSNLEAMSDFQNVTECLPSYVCGGSASVERGFVAEFTEPDQPSCNHHSNDTFRVLTEQREHNIRMNDECDDELHL